MSKLKFDASADAHEMVRTLIGTFAGNVRTVLDVGCGSGEFLSRITQLLDAPGWGVDPFVSEHAEGRATFVPLKAERLEELKRRFDLVYSVHALHHFENIRAFWNGLQHVLSWSGRFILVDWKKGAQTGIAESYFSLSDILLTIADFNFRIIDRGETEANFYLVAELKRRFLAVATDENGEFIYPKMFGQAPFFDIYALENGRFTFVEKRRNIYQKTLQHGKTLDVYKEVRDCQALLAHGIGRNGRQRLWEKGVSLFFRDGAVATALKTIAKETYVF